MKRFTKIISVGLKLTLFVLMCFVYFFEFGRDANYVKAQTTFTHSSFSHRSEIFTNQINTCLTNDHINFDVKGISGGSYAIVFYGPSNSPTYHQPTMSQFTVNGIGDWYWDQLFDFSTTTNPGGTCLLNLNAYNIPTGTYEVRLYDLPSFVNDRTTLNYIVSDSYGGTIYVSTPQPPSPTPTVGPTATPPATCSLAYCSQDSANRCSEQICLGCDFCGCPDFLLTPPNERKYGLCQRVEVNPASGPGNTNFTFVGYNCLNLDLNYYRMTIFDSTGLLNGATPQIFRWDADGDGQRDDIQAQIALATFQNQGAFYAKLFAPIDRILATQCASFNVTSPIAAAECCTIDPTSPGFCGGCTNVGLNDPDLCPASCPPERFNCFNSEVFYCMNRDQCYGFFTGNIGTCRFGGCPDNMVLDGFNPPMSSIGCKTLFACCTDPTNQITRLKLNSNCFTLSGIEGINTAVGCIPVADNYQFLTFVVPWAFGLAGGIAFVLLAVAGIMFSTSAGDPQRIKSAKNLLWSAIIGLIMIVFSVYLLDFIGIRIFQISGL